LNSKKFRTVLSRAVAGNHEALEQILQLYMPMIDKHCRINGVLDEDCKQYVLIHIALNISKFTI
jgi:hypothetical protein